MASYACPIECLKFKKLRSPISRSSEETKYGFTLIDSSTIL